MRSELWRILLYFFNPPIHTQDPYAIASLMPAKTESNRTQPVESGGTQPVWQKQKHESDLVLTWPEGDDSSLLLELWNKVTQF